jgi:hypothetical protein
MPSSGLMMMMILLLILIKNGLTFRLAIVNSLAQAVQAGASLSCVQFGDSSTAAALASFSNNSANCSLFSLSVAPTSSNVFCASLYCVLRTCCSS